MYHPTVASTRPMPTAHCADCANGPVNEHGLRRAHCATCGVLCYDAPDNFEMQWAFCSTFCEDVKLQVTYGVSIDAPLFA